MPNVSFEPLKRFVNVTVILVILAPTVEIKPSKSATDEAAPDFRNTVEKSNPGSEPSKSTSVGHDVNTVLLI